MKYGLLSLIFCSLFFSRLSGQSNYVIQPSAIGVHFIYDVFKNPLDSKGEKYKSGFAGLAVDYQKGIFPHLELVSTISAAIQDFYNRSGVDLGKGNELLLLELDADVRYMLVQKSSRFNPFIQAGIGVSFYNGYSGFYFPAGVGFQLNLTPFAFILLNAQKRFAISSNQDDHYYFSIGLAGYVGRRKYRVSKKEAAGKPLDSDGDGIFDIDDACPMVPGVVRYRGCPIPDRDGDGINDEEDKCPDVPGLIRYQGCPIPDRDGDGINDEMDQCPDIPGVLKYAGCPVPDRDHDGINDEEDHCPDVPGPIINKGCPLVDSVILKKVKLAAKNCFFETGKYKLLPASFKSLNEVVQILKTDSLFRLKIEGYTDNQGNSKANQQLSENRAHSVMDYFIKSGISTKRLSSAGYGQTKPIANNSTVSGRAKNRRVEMKIGSTE